MESLSELENAQLILLSNKLNLQPDEDISVHPIIMRFSMRETIYLIPSTKKAHRLYSASDLFIDSIEDVSEGWFEPSANKCIQILRENKCDKPKINGYKMRTHNIGEL